MINWALRKKLFAAFGAIIALVAISAAATYYGIREIKKLEDEQAQFQDDAIDAQKAHTAMLELRRYEKDYFTRDGQQKYLDLHETSGREFVETVGKLEAAFGESSELASKLQEVTQGWAIYKAAFVEAVKAYQLRGTMNTGLQGEVRRAARELEEAAQALDDERLTVLMLQARRAEKDFLMRGGDKYRANLVEYVKAAREHVKGTAERDRARLVGLLSEYQQKFEGVVAATSDLEARQAELGAATYKVEESIEELAELAHAKAKEIGERNDQVRSTMELVVALVFGITLLCAIGVTQVISRQISSGVSRLIAGTERIGSGDLTSKVAVDSRDELGVLANALNGMSDSLRDMTSNVGTASASLNDMVKELQATVSEQGASMQQQAASVSETVATVDELARSAEQVSEIANLVLDTASNSMTTTKNGAEAIQQSVNGMADVREQVQNIARTILELSEKTQQIGTIIATVDDFAEQSSLLALNASIEAARAGENGKAFSVVAAEVKSLAEQSQLATGKVRSILNDIQQTTHTAVMVTEEGNKRVERGVDLVTTAGGIITNLSQSIAQSADSAKQIAAAARQQNNGIEQISLAMSGIDQFSQQNVEAIKQTETTSQNLASVSDQLQASASRYRV